MEKVNKVFLFLYPIFFAIPNLAINLSVINLRFDDLIVYILLVLHIKKVYTFHYHFLLRTQFYMLFYALISLLIALIFTFHRVSSYEITRVIGSLPHLIILPVIFSNPYYRNSLYKGAFVGGIIYLGSIMYNYNSILKEAQNMEKASSFKSEIGFSTLNPNAVAVIALILGWINVLGYVEIKKKLFLINFLLLLIPFFILARASSLGVFVAILLLVISVKQNMIKKYLIYGLSILVGWLIITFFINEDLLKSATNVNLESGEGLSKRDVLWKQGLVLVENSPFFGYGFCTENGVYTEKFDGHMAHQILLHYAIELGIIALLIFLIIVFRTLKEKWKYYKKSGNIVYLVQMCLFFGFFVADMAGQLLYFNKYAYIIYVIATFTPIYVKYRQSNE